jgi:hypothetical protein
MGSPMRAPAGIARWAFRGFLRWSQRGDRRANYGTDNVYHVIVLVGYNAAQGVVYTNDAGISQGPDLAYAWTTLQTAVQSMARAPVDQSGAAVPTAQGMSRLVFARG